METPRLVSKKIVMSTSSPKPRITMTDSTGYEYEICEDGSYRIIKTPSEPQIGEFTELSYEYVMPAIGWGEKVPTTGYHEPMKIVGPSEEMEKWIKRDGGRGPGEPSGIVFGPPPKLVWKPPEQSPEDIEIERALNDCLWHINSYGLDGDKILAEASAPPYEAVYKTEMDKWVEILEEEKKKQEEEKKRQYEYQRYLDDAKKHLDKMKYGDLPKIIW